MALDPQLLEILACPKCKQPVEEKKRGSEEFLVCTAADCRLAYPVRELIVRFGGIRRGWSFWLPPFVILAASGLFEILESLVAETFAPGKGADWLGAQGCPSR